MPRVRELRPHYMRRDAQKMFKEKMAGLGITQKTLAELIGLSPPAFCVRFKEFDFDFEQLAKMIDKLKFSDKEIVKLMKM